MSAAPEIISIIVKLDIDIARRMCYIYFDGRRNKYRVKEKKEMEEFISALREEKAGLDRQAAELRKENKGDEAVFCTVRANVYDICATVCAVHAKKGDIAAFRAILARFGSEWGAALKAAERLNDAKKICVEETKLEALADVCSRFEKTGCE